MGEREGDGGRERQRAADTEKARGGGGEWVCESYSLPGRGDDPQNAIS